jgi:membrane protein required for colicin V production
VTAFDYAFIAILLSFAVGGLLRGLVREVFGIMAWFAAVWAAVRLGEAFEPFVHSFTDQPQLRWLVASLIVGFIAYIAVVLIGRLVSGAVSAVLLGPIDRMLGLLFGAACALVVIGALTFVGLQFGMAKQEWWKKSHLAPVALQASMLLDRVVGFDYLLKGDRNFEMPKAVQEAEERARQLMQGIRETNEATASPQPEQ